METGNSNRDGGIGLSMECEDDELLPWQLDQHHVEPTVEVEVPSTSQASSNEKRQLEDNSDSTVTKRVCESVASSVSNAAETDLAINHDLNIADSDQRGSVFEPLPLQLLTVDELNCLDFSGFDDLNKDSEFLIDGCFPENDDVTEYSVGIQEDDYSCPTQPVAQFNWTKSLSEANLLPFEGNCPGPRVQSSTETFQPIDFFFMFFSKNLISQITTATNRYAVHYKASDWKKLEGPDVQAFLGMIVIMPISPRIEITDYWSSDTALSNPFISQVMSAKKFQQIARYLCFCNPDTLTTEPKRCALNRIQPYLKMVRDELPNAYDLHEEVIVMDASSTFGIHRGLEIVLPQNFTKYGWKVFILRDHESGYIKDFYFISSPYKDSETHVATSVIQEFIPSVRNKNHRMYLDKGLCSLDVCRLLLINNVYVCGATEPSTIGIPNIFGDWSSVLPTQEPFIKPGDYMVHQEQDTAIIVWAGIKQTTTSVPCSLFTPTVLLSTMHETGGVACAYDFVGPHLPAGQPRLCPRVVAQYHRHLSRHVAFRQNFSVQRATHSWWKCALWFCIDVALNNAFVLWTELKGNSKTRKDFQLEVGKSLVNDYSNRERRVDLQESQPVQSAFDSKHQLVKMYGRARTCRMCRSLKRDSKPRESTYGCSVCRINLCRSPCFIKYHLQFVDKVLTSKVLPELDPKGKEVIANREGDCVNDTSSSEMVKESATGECEAHVTLTSHKKKPPTAPHICVALGKKKRVCQQCRQDGNTWPNGNVKETTWGCSVCKMYLHKGTCFQKYHSSRTQHRKAAEKM